MSYLSMPEKPASTKPKVPRPRKSELSKVKEENGEDHDSEEVPDHEKVRKSEVLKVS